MRIYVVALALLLAGCAVAPGGDRVFTKSSLLGPLVHQRSGFVFPAQIGDFSRGQVARYGQAGEDVSVGYNAFSTPIVATVYVYPTRGKTLAQEFKARQSEIAAFHPQAKRVALTNAVVTPQHHTAPSAVYAMTDQFNGKRQELLSRLVVARTGDRFVEYRFSYPSAVAPDAASQVSDFQRRFSWPK